jgi:signal peptidase I
MTSGLIFEKNRTDQEVRSMIHPTIAHEIRGYVGYFFRVFGIVTLVFVLLRTNVYQVTTVEGKSMDPNYTNGDVLFIDLFNPKFSDYQRGEVVVVYPPDGYGQDGKYFIKRIIGLPGESVGIDEGKVRIYNDQYQRGLVLNENAYLAKDVFTTIPNRDTKTYIYPKLEKNEYFVMGDNRPFSADSRVFGKIAKDRIIGKEFYRSFPSKSVGFFSLPAYNIRN